MNYVHLQMLMSADCHLKIRDIWIDRSMDHLEYILVEDAKGVHPLPSPCLKFKQPERKVEFSCPSDSIGNLETVDTPEKMTVDIESRLWKTLGLKPLSSDDESSDKASTSNGKLESTCRSTSGIIGRKVESSTGRLGSIVDMIFDPLNWKLKYVLVEDEKLQGRFILVDPEWFEDMSAAGDLYVNLSREILLLEAVFDQKTDLNRRYHIDV